jgi:two-component system chemotaxis response regulator CheB
LRVLVVDDSAFMRKIITDILSSDPELNVVGTAFDGLDALRKVATLHPDVMTLDVAMPRMDGLATLKHIMEQNPLPIIMVSSTTREGTETTLKALEYGAMDYVTKPSGEISLNMGEVKNELITKIKNARNAKIIKHEQMIYRPIQHKQEFKSKVILMGASTGGPQALEGILTKLPEDTPPILIVQHMPAGFTKSFAERLEQLCKFEVKEAEEGDNIVARRALLAPGGYHMTVGQDERVHLNTGSALHGVRPAVDPMMEAAAKIYQSKTIGVILTGMGRDGALGMKAVKNCGGTTIAQDEATSTIFGMPKAAIEEGCVDETLPISEIPQEIVRKCQT